MLDALLSCDDVMAIEPMLPELGGGGLLSRSFNAATSGETWKSSSESELPVNIKCLRDGDCPPLLEERLMAVTYSRQLTLFFSDQLLIYSKVKFFVQSVNV